MTIETRWESVAGSTTSMDVFVASSATPTGSGIVMLQEIFGVNEAMRLKAIDFAEAGFTVVVPDLFWRQVPRVDLSYTEADRAAGFGLMQQFDFEAGVSDVLAAADWLRGQPSIANVAVVGFCLGGKLAVMAGASDAFDAVAQIEATLRDRHNAQVFTYPGAQHGFFNPARADVYDAAAASSARDRTIAMLRSLSPRHT
jgi:carboxymethylenebutenolidase